MVKITGEVLTIDDFEKHCKDKIEELNHCEESCYYKKVLDNIKMLKKEKQTKMVDEYISNAIDTLTGLKGNVLDIEIKIEYQLIQEEDR